MATISTVTDTTIFQIKHWMGVNENPDGDTRLKLGEAAEMRNWRVTKNGSLQIRPGTEMKHAFWHMQNSERVNDPVQGMWYGLVGGANKFVVAAGSTVYVVDPDTLDTGDHDGEYNATALTGSVANGHVEFFPYEGKLYILDGTTYQSWDGLGTALSTVTGYTPTIITNAAPASGAGTAGEQINLLSRYRRVLYTVGSDTTLHFKLAELGLGVSAIVNEVTGETIPSTSYTIHFIDNMPEHGIDYIDLSGVTLPTSANGVSITYAVFASEDQSDLVAHMRFAEFYNGANNNRVFLYGDGTNRCIYSGLTSTGNPTAEYFPAMNEIVVGEDNDPITGLIRHFSRLICYKKSSTYSIQYSAITLEDGTVTAGFYLTPTNRAIGNEAPGQVRLVNNNPLTLCSGAVYEWRSNSSNNGNLTYDERQAHIISDRIENTLKRMTFKDCICYDHDYEQEYYICWDDDVIVYNYENNAWYSYTNLKIKNIVEIGHRLVFGMADGTIRIFTRNARYDYRCKQTWDTFDGQTPFSAFENVPGPVRTKYMFDDSGTQMTGQCFLRYGFPYTTESGATLIPADADVLLDDGRDEIDAYWRSGSLSFDRDWKRKYAMQLWVGLLPESESRVTITAVTDRDMDYPVKEIAFGTVGFGAIDFADFSFGSFVIPQTRRIKLKVKKFVFYRLIFESKSKTNTATLLSTDIQVRYAGNAK